MKYTKFRGIRRPQKFFDEVCGWLRLRLEWALWRDLAPLMVKSSSKGCTFHELDVLYRHIVRHRPKYVLELGAGISTVVLAHAAEKVRRTGAPCTIISMEENPSYYKELKNLFTTGVSNCVELIQSPTEDRKIGGRIARCYVTKPRHAYDFVFIDGPQVPKDANYFDGDILDVVEWNSKAFTAYLDGRLETQENLIRLFPFAQVSFDKHHKLTRFDFPSRGSARKRSANGSPPEKPDLIEGAGAPLSALDTGRC